MTKRKASHQPRQEDEADRGGFRWRPSQLWLLAKRTGKEFVEDKAPRQAAALAYYTLFALGPLLVVAVTLASLVLSGTAAQQAVLDQFETLVGADGRAALADLMEGASGRLGALGAALGLVVLAFSAMAVFGQLKEALNRAWEVQATKAEGWKGKVVDAVRKNALSFVGVVGTGFLLLVSLVLSAAISALGTWLSGVLPLPPLALQAINLLFAFVVISLVFASIFRVLPDARVAWRDVAVGSGVTAALFLVGQAAIGFYLGRGALATEYGAAGAVLAILFWVYYSSLILLLGAEFTQVYANVYGSHVRPSDDAVPYHEAIQERESSPEREGREERERPRRDRRAT